MHIPLAKIIKIFQSRIVSGEKKYHSSRKGAVCPLCGQGHIIRGKTAFGCSRWREGCTYRVPFQ